MNKIGSCVHGVRTWTRYMSYEEEDICHMRTRINGVRTWTRYMSYEEEDTCHMRRRIHGVRTRRRYLLGGSARCCGVANNNHTHTSNDNIINRI